VEKIRYPPATHRHPPPTTGTGSHTGLRRLPPGPPRRLGPRPCDGGCRPEADVTMDAE
jgi:hypothetical protein